MLEAANRLEPRWAWACDQGSKRGGGPDADADFKLYPRAISDQIEEAFADKAVASFSLGRTDYTIDCGLEVAVQVNRETRSQRLVRRQLVEMPEETAAEEAVPPVFLDAFPSYWVGNKDVARHTLPGDGAVGSRMLALMLGSVATASAAGMAGLQIDRVERIENHNLWGNYQRYRHVISKRLGSGRTEQPLAERAAVAPVLQSEGDGEQEGDELQSRVLCRQTNELYLWHGTKPEVVDTLAQHGLDPRKSGMGGLYGAGTYFADASSSKFLGLVRVRCGSVVGGFSFVARVCKPR